MRAIKGHVCSLYMALIDLSLHAFYISGVLFVELSNCLTTMFARHATRVILSVMVINIAIYGARPAALLTHLNGLSLLLSSLSLTSKDN